MRYKHAMVFRCRCKAEHVPKPGLWEQQSAEAGAAGWRVVHAALRGYVLMCGKCAEACEPQPVDA